MQADRRALIHRWFDEVWNRQIDATVDEILTPDTILHGLSHDGRPLVGPNGFREFRQKFTNAFSDIRFTVLDIVHEDDRTAARVAMTGRHTGDALGIPPTGKNIQTTCHVLAHWADLHVKEAWHEFDSAGLQRQLAIPAASNLQA